MLRQALKSLDLEVRSQLKMAHENSIPQYHKLPDGKFIGVFLNGYRNLKVEETVNDWYYGTILINNQSGHVNNPGGQSNG